MSNSICLNMIVKNEEKHLQSCLESIQPFVDEIVVVDTGSTDGTVDLVRSFGARVFFYKWDGSFANARNYSLQQTRSDWHIVLDADEVFDQNSEKVMKEFISSPPAIGRIRITSDFESTNEIRQAQTFVSRIFPRGIFYKGAIHEQLSSHLARRNTNIDVRHSGYLHTEKTERNLSILKEVLKKNPNEGYYHYQIAKEYKKLKKWELSKEHFFKSYKLSKRNEPFFPPLVSEYLYVLLELQSFTTAFEIAKEQENQLKDYPDFFFVCGLLYLHYASIHPSQAIPLFEKIEQSFLRSLAIGDVHPYEGVIGTGSFLSSYNLGILYELLGQHQKAKQYYTLASSYPAAATRLHQLTGG